MQFLPQTGRDLAEFLHRICATWATLTPEDRASGDFINPDEPVVLTVPNPEYDDEYEEDDLDNDRSLHFHVESHGGGGDMDNDGTECGHHGASICGMEIDQRTYLYNGRRYK